MPDCKTPAKNAVNDAKYLTHKENSKLGKNMQNYWENARKMYIKNTTNSWATSA